MCLRLAVGVGEKALTSGTENLVSSRSKYVPLTSLCSRRPTSLLAVPGGPISSMCSPLTAARRSRRTCMGTGVAWRARRMCLARERAFRMGLGLGQVMSHSKMLMITGDGVHRVMAYLGVSLHEALLHRADCIEQLEPDCDGFV